MDFNLYRKKKRRHDSFEHIRPNIYDQRVNNNVTQQFKDIHGGNTMPSRTQMSDEAGLRLAYDSPDRLYHHRNKLFVAGTKDWPNDLIDDLKLPYEDTLNLTKRGRDVEAYYRNHMREIDTVIGHSLGGSVALSLEDKYRHDKNGIPNVGIKQVKTFSAPVVAGNLGGNNQLVKGLIVNSSEKIGSAIGGQVGIGLDSLTGFTDEGLFTKSLADAGGKLGKTVSDKLTSRPENNPDRIRYYGDLISALDFNAKTVMPSEEFKQKYSPHSYRGLSIQDKVPEHDIEITPLTSQPVDVKSQQLTK